MSSTPPLINQTTGRIDREKVLVEAIPLVELVGLVVVIALVPFAIAMVLGPSGVAGIAMLLSQFTLAVGSGVVLLYVISRGIQIANE